MNSYVQDWQQIILHRPTTKSNQKTPHFELSREQKIDNETENLSHITVGGSTGKKIQTLRIAKGFKTQKELAKKINVTANVINDYETGKVVPDNTTLQKLKRVLGKF